MQTICADEKRRATAALKHAREQAKRKASDQREKDLYHNIQQASLFLFFVFIASFIVFYCLFFLFCFVYVGIFARDISFLSIRH